MGDRQTLWPGAIAVLAVTLVAACATALLRTDVATSAAMLLVAATAITSIVVGVRRHRPHVRWPWVLIVVCSGTFLVASIVRATGAASASDVLTLTGYLALTAAAVRWLRPAPSKHRADLLLDTTLVGLGALLASWTLLISPALLHRPAQGVAEVVGAAFPAIDALLLAFIALSTFTSDRSQVALNTLQLALTSIVVGDLGFAFEFAYRRDLDDALQTVPFLIGYGAVGMAALHPSMATLSRRRPSHPERSRQRASVLAVVLIVGAMVPVLGSELRFVDQVMVSGLLAVLLIGVLVRSERAIIRSARSEQLARYQATHDTLTGLPNRSALLRELAARRDGTADTSVLFIDLDGFKMVNDSFGHAVGDELIAKAAARVRAAIRRGDFAARYGGDEFVVVAELDRPGAVSLAKRLIDTLGVGFDVGVGQVRISASIGIAVAAAESDRTDVDALIRDADEAMYLAKERGQGAYACARDGIPLPIDAEPLTHELPRASNE